MGRITGIDPVLWHSQCHVLPLHYTRHYGPAREFRNLDLSDMSRTLFLWAIAGLFCENWSERWDSNPRSTSRLEHLSGSKPDEDNQTLPLSVIILFKIGTPAGNWTRVIWLKARWTVHCSTGAFKNGPWDRIWTYISNVYKTSGVTSLPTHGLKMVAGARVELALGPIKVHQVMSLIQHHILSVPQLNKKWHVGRDSNPNQPVLETGALPN